MSRKRKANYPSGRHYADDEWVEFILDGFPESMEVDVDEVPITDELQAEVDRFMEAADKAVEQCSKQFPPAEEIYLSDADYADIYHTLVGAGVGIWDGRWDHYYPNYTQADWDKLSACLNKKLGKFADFAGGGSLNEAFMEAVYAAEREHRGKRLKPKQLSQLKNKLLR